MDLIDLQLPRLADTLVEGTVSRWLRRPGDRVRKGEAVVEIETDKVNTELEAPADGVLSEVLVAEGETVPVGQVLARIGGVTAAEPAPRRPPATAPLRTTRLAEHLSRAAVAVPQGACVREIPAGAVDRLPDAARAAAGELEVAVLPASRAHISMPALLAGQAAALAPGAERDGRRLLTLCYDRRVLDDWQADQLLKRISLALDQGL
jgi:pyruvate/2-oxoglutarate dehydrogenase complex dihydrolipoamide acyltransferase (E2) component